MWGIRAFDTAPDSIVRRLARRDDRPHSDWVDVVIDSYLDRRTAFRFGVNPAGVKSDAYMFDDTNEDDSWDAVWEVATQIDDLGWTAEFRIPYSQLRFDGAVRQTWGLNFVRYVGRHLETSLWAPISRGDGAMVSRFGKLVGLDGISPPMRLEVTPYSLASVQAAPGSADDPFHADRDFASMLGADAKYGITSDLTLDLTVNPDFGQVEADPAQVNLSAFETFLDERRPFFVEGGEHLRLRLLTGRRRRGRGPLLLAQDRQAPPGSGIGSGLRRCSASDPDPRGAQAIGGRQTLDGRSGSCTPSPSGRMPGWPTLAGGAWTTSSLSPRRTTGWRGQLRTCVAAGARSASSPPGADATPEPQRSWRSTQTPMPLARMVGTDSEATGSCSEPICWARRFEVRRRRSHARKDPQHATSSAPTPITSSSTPRGPRSADGPRRRCSARSPADTGASRQVPWRVHPDSMRTTWGSCAKPTSCRPTSGSDSSTTGRAAPFSAGM